MASDRFTFLAAYLEDAEDMSVEEKAEYYDSVIKYGIMGTEPDEFEHPIVKLAFRHAKRMIDEGTTRRENGNKGGRPKPDENLTETKGKPNDNLTITKPKPNDNQTITKPEPNHNLTVTKPEPNHNLTVTKGKPNDNQTETKEKDKNKKEKEKDKIKDISLSLTPSPSDNSGDSDGERERKSDFDVFWDAYPRKEAQSAALKAWADAVEAGDIRFGDGAVIASAVERSKQTSQWQQEDGRFIPMPARYLSERRWRDQPTEIPGAGSFKSDEFFELALKKSYEGMEERGTA